MMELFLFCFSSEAACEILVPNQGSNLVALEGQSLNHWTAREVPLQMKF